MPRLIDGNVAIEAFTVVTKSPRGLNNQRNDDRSDMITPLAIVERWPPRTWTSLRERALYQARKLQDTAARSDGRLTLLRTSAASQCDDEQQGQEPKPMETMNAVGPCLAQMESPATGGSRRSAR